VEVPLWPVMLRMKMLQNPVGCRKDMQKSSSISTALKPPVSKLFMHSWPELHGYCQLVCDFSCKDLTYPKDVVDSFSGITIGK
jgi:hypothetical protein